MHKGLVGKILLLMTREQTHKNYDRLSRWYDRFAGSEKAFTDLGLQMLAVKEGERVLEIGFGTGHALAALEAAAGSAGAQTDTGTYW